jgi:hypothetical protein
MSKRAELVGTISAAPTIRTKNTMRKEEIFVIEWRYDEARQEAGLIICRPAVCDQHPSVFFEHSFGKIKQGHKDERL